MACVCGSSVLEFEGGMIVLRAKLYMACVTVVRVGLSGMGGVQLVLRCSGLGFLLGLFLKWYCVYVLCMNCAVLVWSVCKL